MGAFKRSLILFAATSITFSIAEARYACSLIFQTQSAEVQRLVKEDAYEQWLLWEQTANVSMFEKPTASFQLPITVVPRSEIKVEVDPSVPTDFYSFVNSGPGVLWFQHPYNTADIVPYRLQPPTASVEAYFTASRSIALGGKFRGLTIKVGTDHPHGPKGELQTGKADTADDVKTALLHTSHLKKIDKVLGEDPEFVMLPEVMTVSAKDSRVGYVIRDVRATDSGHYYLPALSIPFVGREIAKINGEAFETFWLTHYAELLGRAKARMLLRYGLQMETPNAQNMLIQFDRNLKPTGRIIFRDISDSHFVETVGKGFGFDKEMGADLGTSNHPRNFIRPYWRNSAWRFDEAGKLSVRTDVIDVWGQKHDAAYLNYLKHELKIDDIPGGAPAGEDAWANTYRFFASPQGQAALQAYRSKIANQ